MVQSVPDGGAAAAPTASRSGYTFDGWDQSFSNVTADMTVTAQWTDNGGVNHDPINPPAPGVPISIGSDATFAFNGDYADLDEIRLNNHPLTQTSNGAKMDLSGYPGYAPVLGCAEAGSVKVTLYKEFLKTLPNGVYSLTVSFSDGGEGELEFEIQQPTVNPVTSSSSGGSGSSGGGSSVQDTIKTTVPSALVVDTAKAKAALADMAKSVANKARIRHTGEIRVLAEAWQVFGNIPVDFDTLDAGAVQERISVPNPGLMKGEVMLSGYVKGNIVDNRKAFFEKWFKNKVQVIHFDQAEPWGQPVEIAAKLDLTGMDTSSLYFYSYDSKANTYQRIKKPAYWIDKNGYLHFTTEMAGAIIISKGPLDRK